MGDNNHFMLGTKDGIIFVPDKPGMFYVINVESGEEYKAIILINFPLELGYPIHRAHLRLVEHQTTPLTDEESDRS